MKFRVIWLHPGDVSSYVAEELTRLPLSDINAFHRHASASSIAMIIDGDGAICMPETAYLAACGQRSRSVELDTQRTYAESLVAWLNYAAEKNITPHLVGEREIQGYRNSISNPSAGRTLAAATTGLRVGVVIRFIRWCQMYGWASSPFGRKLLETPRGNVRLSRSGWRGRGTTIVSLPRIGSTSPRMIDSAALQAISNRLSQPYQLIMTWALSTGLRRAEICRLTLSDLDSVSSESAATGLVQLRVLRKGGKEQNVLVLQKLIDDTRWYINMSRPESSDGVDFIFLTKNGTKVDKQTISRRFKLACEYAGVNSTFHSLRHTFALNVLDILERQAARGAAINPLKTLQVLMGHSSLETTDIYLQSLQVMSPVVEHALDFLYGKTKDMNNA